MNEEVASSSSKAAPASARQVLVDWANQQDPWVRQIVAEVLAGRRELPLAAIAAIVEQYLVEKGLKQGPLPAVPDLALVATPGAIEDVLRLISLRSCKGINALVEEQEIRFHPRLTVLFGENAVGKSGYVRVLKQVAQVRSAEPILPDVNRPSTSMRPEATVTYAVGPTEATVVWRGESGLPPLTRMTVFDSPAVLMHLEGAVNYVFTPSDLALFRFTHAAIEGVRAALEGLASERAPKGNPFLTAFARGTPVYPEIEALGASSDAGRLSALAQVSHEELVELAELRSTTEALGSTAQSSRKEALRARIALVQHLEALLEVVEQFAIDAYSAAIGASTHAAEAAAQAADAVRAPDPLTDESQVPWTSFLQGGEAYLLASRLDGYPESDGHVCIYCRQTLDAEAKRRIRQYRDYAGGAQLAALERAKRSLDESSAEIVAPSFVAHLSAATDHLKALDDEGTQARGWVADGRRLVAWAADLQVVVASRSSAPMPLDGHAREAMRVELRSAREEATRTLSALEGDLAEQARVLTAARARVAALEARLTLQRLLPDIVEHVGRATWVHRLRALLGRMPTLLRGLTEASKVASQDLLNRDFERLFLEECVALRAPTVTLDFPGRRGEASRRKSVTSQYPIGAILSQGEQKVIAIADFLAEAALRTSSAPIVFDDPVDSFDHRRVTEIARRIADLSNEHQVIVFTHDIMFAASLLGHFDDNKGAVTYLQISGYMGAKGVVSKATHARLDTVSSIKARLNEAIQAAQAGSIEARQAAVDAAYDHLRAWCEVAVETRLLAKVTQRYQPNVAMQELERIRPERLAAAIQSIVPVWEKANRYIPAHSQPLQSLGIRPTLEELREDWASLQKALSDYEAA